VLNLWFRQPVIAVDTHIFRVANRTRLAPAKTPEEASALLMQRTPKQYLLDAHHYLLLHGRYTCTARNPKCGECVLAGLCPSKGA
jgi:endonuclease-3